MFRSILLAGLALATAGCAEFSFRRHAPESAPIIQGPAVSNNTTLFEPTFACYRNELVQRIGGRRPHADTLSISVGEVRDYTGKSSINEGAALTQGGTLMVISALGRLAPAVRVHERFDPRVAELELIYSDRRQLGDGRLYGVPGNGGRQVVPWLPYMGGTIMNSRYFIVGGITELNWNVQSGGVDYRQNGVGPQARVFTANIAADLRIVDTRTLIVLKTISLQKQVTGHEVGLNIFRFFGSRLFDISTGTRNQEPIQLAVRAVLEQGVLELVSAVSGVPFERCAEPAVRAGILSRAYDVSSERVPAPSEQPPMLPEPLRDRMESAPPPPPAPTMPRARLGNGRGPGAAGGFLAPAAQPAGGRPDAQMRPPLPGFLEGPTLLPPPGSLSLMPSAPPAVTDPGTLSPFPDPQRQIAPGRGGQRSDAPEDPATGQRSSLERPATPIAASRPRPSLWAGTLMLASAWNP